MTVKNARQYIEEHKKELQKQFHDDAQATKKDYQKLCAQIRSGKIEGIIYPDGSIWTPR